MKKGEFDLTNKAIDCSGLPEMGDAGKEIFRALKVACNGVNNPAYGKFESISNWGVLAIEDGDYVNAKKEFTDGFMLKFIRPSDVLGQAAIDAAIDGATIVFEGDTLPFHSGKIRVYNADGGNAIFGCGFHGDIVPDGECFIAYKLLEKKPLLFEYRAQPDALNFMNIKITDSSKALVDAVNKSFPSSIESRVLAEKMGFKELCPVCSPKEWQERESESYDDLRDAHLDLVRESMEKEKEIELLKQRIKDLHRAMNDAKAALDV